MSKKILLTGGGTAGHCVPNLALVPALKTHGFKPIYIGSYTGIERKLVTAEKIPYYAISTGKLRRYFDWKNFTDPFRVINGFFQAYGILRRERPDIVFSKGGFVSVPVVKAAKLLKIPVIIHESDMTPGLANKLSYSSASKICCSFRETLQYLPKNKAVFTGSPIRDSLLSGDRGQGFAFTGLTRGEKPTILVVGGSLGAQHVNEAVRHLLPTLLKSYNVVHLCGKGKLDESLKNTPGYVQYEYISSEMADLFAMADIVISRAGANAIFELLALKKPNILIPLPVGSSRGDQLLNARSFEKAGYSYLLKDEDLSDDTLTKAIKTVRENSIDYIQAMENAEESGAVEKIADLIAEIANK
ncbi:UDP-N-acetylglucosamine-N-acetylmuramylpentapeptide N-acetylglucosamine transferase [Lachnospiraceae bacterium KH1T2]|nr:UDP-N-acetylglucosamine-N-acetylmuramylpentapeptide N-acetylglucosamine transferase [Lachnospiraceae bacterium KH1T2]